MKSKAHAARSAPYGRPSRPTSVTSSTPAAKSARPKRRSRRSIAPTASLEAPRAGLEPATNRLHRVPPFPTGVDYLITMDLAACRWRALEGSLFFRHSLVSAPSSRRLSREAWLRVTICMLHLSGRSHVGFPEFTRFFIHQFPGEAAERHSRLLYQLSYRGMSGLYRTGTRVAIRVTSRAGHPGHGRRSSRRCTRGRRPPGCRARCASRGPRAVSGASPGRSRSPRPRRSGSWRR